MSSLDLKFKIKVDGGKDLEGSLKASKKQLAALTKETSSYGNKSKVAFSKSKKELSALQKQAGSAKTALLGVFSGVAAYQLASGILEVNREMESLRAQLKSLTGSNEGSAQAFKFIQDFAADTPFQVQGLTKTFIDLKNFGIEPTTEVMNAITNQASKLGASQETLSGITLALGQAYAKGKLQAEEMLQLVERGVPVYKLLAESTGKNADELSEMSKKGELGRDVIDQLIVKMGDLASGSNADAMDTLNGSISNLNDSWVNFQDTLLNDESEGVIKSIIQGITSTINDFVKGDSVDQLTAKLERYKKALADGDSNYTTAELLHRIDSVARELDKKIPDLELPAGDKPKSDKSGNKQTGSTGGSKSDPGKKVVENLQRQLALYDETTNAAKFRYELEQGSLQNVSDAQKTIIANYADQLDALDASKQEQIEYDEVVAEGIELAKKQREEMEAERDTQIEAISQIKTFLQESNRTELEELQAHYDERKRIILESTVITEEERLALLAELDEVSLAQRQAFSDAQNMLLLSSASNSFGEIAELTKTFAGEQSAAYKAAFAVSKAFAIAETTIKTYQAAQDAYTAFSSIPYVGPALGAAAAAAAVAAGLGRVAQISSQNVSGIAHGGLDNVPSESTYLLDKGERVLSPKQNTDLTLFLKKSNTGESTGGGGGNTYNITVNVKTAEGETAGNTGRKAADAITRAIARQEIKQASRPNGLLNKTTKFV